MHFAATLDTVQQPLRRSSALLVHRLRAGERPVVAHIDPATTGIGLALRQHTHRGIVAVQPLHRQNMRLDQLKQRL